jgi:8-oxo-dGTP pyrophosphatase MutT (NUDIX family)
MTHMLPQPAVIMLLRDRRDRFLVIRRAEGRARGGWWSPPSGRVEAGETEAQAVARELREELGLDGSGLRRVWQCDSDDGRFRIGWWLCATTPGPIVADPVEVAEWRWVDVAAFLALAPIFDRHREFFAEHWPVSQA